MGEEVPQGRTNVQVQQVVAGVGHSGGDVFNGFHSHKVDFSISLKDIYTNTAKILLLF